MKQQANAAAIYCRLSRDDGGDAESNSVSTQRQMLRRYAKEQGFSVYGEYVDDGISGTTFERPDWKRMIRDIEDGKIGIVLCKDLSRLGRNNALVAYYTELFFPDNDVRLIAVTNSIDTIDGDNEIMPFLSVVNEFYACVKQNLTLSENIFSVSFPARPRARRPKRFQSRSHRGRRFCQPSSPQAPCPASRHRVADEAAQVSLRHPPCRP
jgi:hypothetical protein